MDKVRSRIFRFAAFALIMAWALSGTASAGLMQTQFGFPVIVHSGNSVSFSNDQASSTDSEMFNMDFPAFDGIMSGYSLPGLSSMPGIGTGQSLLTFPTTSGFGHIENLGFNLL